MVYKPNNVIQGFTVLSQAKSQIVLNHYNLENDIFTPSLSEAEYNIEYGGDDLDASSSSTVRREQAALRRILLGSSLSGTCCICGESFPADLLVAAHIKKRSSCTDVEKRDISNIAALMCKFGCDDLYEKGYIGVKEGKIVKIKIGLTTKSTELYIKKLVNKNCLKWDSSTESYFSWHFNQHNLMRVDL